MEVLDLSEVCKFLKITVDTARNRICRGEPMPPSFKIGRRWLFLASELDKWIEAQATTHAENSIPNKNKIKSHECEFNAKEKI